MNRKGRIKPVSDRRRAEFEAEGVPVNFSTFARRSPYAALDAKSGQPLRPFRAPRQRRDTGPTVATCEAEARRLVYARSGGACERCDQARAVHWHHRQNRSQGGRWEPANGLHLCAHCHHEVTISPTESEVAGWTVPRGIDPATVPVRHAVHRRVYLDNDGGWSA